MYDDYLIPANTKRGQLILGLFRPFDFALFGSGAAVTLLLLLIFQSQMSTITVAIATMLPVLITGFLVIPVPNYHNVLVFFTNCYNFYFVNNQRYKWKGWCNEYGEENNEQQ